MIRATLQRLGWLCASSLAVLVACSADPPSTMQRGGPASLPGTAGAASGGGAGARSDLPAGNAGTGAAGTSPSTEVLLPNGDEACAASSMQAEQIERQVEVEVQEEIVTREPVALYIMLDQSQSMADGPWFPAVTALTDFVNDPDSENIDVALEFFPLDGFCDGAGFDQPAVPLGRLPGHAQAIRDALFRLPDGIGTPIEGALRGIARFCAGFQAQNPDEACVGVLLTDGAPLGCAGDLPTLTSIASDALMNDGVLTFTIALLGADPTLLHEIARAGGSDCDPAGAGYACDTTTGANLTDALNLIRDQVTEVVTRIETRIEVETVAVDCHWTVPEPPPGRPFDKDQVNVRLTSGGVVTDFGRVEMPDACGDLRAAWYYDDPSAPREIIACEATCSDIQARTDARIDILLGCKTNVIVE